MTLNGSKVMMLSPFANAEMGAGRDRPIDRISLQELARAEKRL